MRAGWSELGAVDPKALREARLQAHHAVQWVTRAARANLSAKLDDSHTNLGWDPALRALMSHDLVAANANTCRVGVRVDAMVLFVAKGSEILGEFALDTRTDAEASAWIDGVASNIGLQPPSTSTVPYDIPAHPVAAGGRYSCPAGRADFAELARWFDAADDILQETKSPLASDVRCWPHHFDIATLLSLGTGGPETAAAIGTGMSPGDGYYAQPYFYISPWPAPALDALPSLPAPGRWHTVGFVGAIATGDAILGLADPRASLRLFIAKAVDICRQLGRA